ncbi:Uncharacterised protein [uncultured Clostridium sp.]|nr:Uncharacterised protein [uncultured Clostridium sp.]
MQVKCKANFTYGDFWIDEIVLESYVDGKIEIQDSYGNTMAVVDTATKLRDILTELLK